MTGFKSKRASALDKFKGQGMKKVIVRTELMQELEVPDDWEREHVLDFLGEYQSFRTAFQGVSNEDQTAVIQEVTVVIETVEQLGEECFDE
jgi:hypothetical protein